MGKEKSKTQKVDDEINVSSFAEGSQIAVGAFFNGLTIPEETEFDLYKHKSKPQYELHGENDTLEYVANNNNNGDDDDNDDDFDQKAAKKRRINVEDDCNYCVGIYDHDTNSIELYEAPMLKGKVIAKSKRRYNGPRIKLLGTRNNIQRNALGEAFGTKKAKSAISSLERNRIDADKLQDMELDIIDSVKETTQELPTKQQMDQESSDVRPIPPIDLNATNVEDIYPISGIIPKPDFSTIRIVDDMSNLPFNKSTYIDDFYKSDKHKTDTSYKLIYYLSILLALYHNRRVRDKTSFLTKLEHQPPESLTNNILNTFTVGKAGKFGKSKDKAFIIDPHNEDKLLCYILVIILHIDNFLVQIQPLSYELNLKPAKLVNLCRIMGANVKPATLGQAEALSIPKTLASTSKLASLTAPVKLPDMSKRVRKGGR